MCDRDSKACFLAGKMVPKSILVALVTIVIATTASGTLTSEEKIELLNAHNGFRSQVYPLATNMVKLVRNQHSYQFSDTSFQ